MYTHPHIYGHMKDKVPKVKRKLAQGWVTLYHHRCGWCNKVTSIIDTQSGKRICCECANIAFENLEKRDEVKR